MNDRELFEMTLRAFNLFTPAEQRLALEHFASLKYSSIDDRFIEAVDRVIRESRKQGASLGAVDA